MGMAASQARLLSLTSRLHDVEFRAQAIESQKIALATQKDELYENYCAALDATKFQVAFTSADGVGKNWETASYKNLCTYMGKERYQDYALKDNKSGLLIESEDVVNNYKKYSGDKYAFAWAMLGYLPEESNDWMCVGLSGVANRGGSSDENGGHFTLERSSNVDGGNSLMSGIEYAAYEHATGENKTTLDNLYKEVETALEEGDTKKRDEAVKAFRDKLYSIPETRDYIIQQQEGSASKKTWDDIADEFNYYCRKFEAIKSAGGCTAIDAQFESGSKGETWLKNMVEAGMITILANNEPKGASANWKETSVATSTNGNWLSEVQDDKDLKKAEAEYEHELSIINTKDTKFDRDLSKLETERKAITTEMDAIKSVKDENIDRTFGIFS